MYKVANYGLIILTHRSSYADFKISSQNPNSNYGFFWASGGISATFFSGTVVIVVVFLLKVVLFI